MDNLQGLKTTDRQRNCIGSAKREKVMKSDDTHQNDLTNKVNETVYKIRTYNDKISDEKVKRCIESKVLKKISTIDYASEK